MTGVLVMESVRSGGGGCRKRAVTVTIVAAVLLTVVDVLTAFDESYDDFSKLRRRHRTRQAVKEFDDIYHRETSSKSQLRYNYCTVAICREDVHNNADKNRYTLIYR